MLLLVAGIKNIVADTSVKNMPKHTSYHDSITQSWNWYKPIFKQQRHAFSAKAFFSHTVNGYDFSKVLNPGGKESIQLNSVHKGDINPIWINLFGFPAVQGANGLFTWNYKSQVTLKPYRYQGGIWFDWFGKLSECFALRGIMSVAGMASGIKITEEGGGNGSYPNPASVKIKNFKQAMQQSAYKYGKISEKETAYGVGILAFDVEYQPETSASGRTSIKHHIKKDGKVLPYMHTTTTRQTYGLRLQLPTGKGSKAEYLFEPRVGTNHMSLGTWWQYADYQDLYTWGLQLGAHLYLPAHETRSLDLNQPNGPWSRYLLLDTDPFYNDIPAINILTQRVRVFPGFAAYLHLCSEYAYEKHNVRLDYRVFAKTREFISLASSIDAGYSVYNIGRSATGLPVGLNLDSMRYARIDQGDASMFNPAQETEFIELTNKDLDTKSAASPAWISSLVAVDYQYQVTRGAFELGVHAEVAHSAGAMSSIGTHFGYVYEF